MLRRLVSFCSSRTVSLISLYAWSAIATGLVAVNFVAISFCHAEQASDVSAEQESSRRWDMLAQYSPRYRRLRETLLSLDQLQTSGRAAESLKTVQWLLDQPFDTFLFVDGKPPASVKRLTEAKLRSFPDEWQKQYERIYGLQARQLLAEAQARDDDALAIEVLRRFGVTAAARDAEVWLAIRWLDRGEAAAALSLIAPAALEPEALRQQSSAALLVMRQAAISVGQTGFLQVIESELADRDVPFRRETPRPASPNQAIPPRAPPVEQLTVGQANRLENYGRDIMPVLRPQWTVEPVAVDSSPHLQSILDAWRSHQQELNLVPVSPALPLIVRNQVILRGYDGLSGFDAARGTLLWSFRCESSISAWIDEAARNRQLNVDSGQMLPAELLQWWLSSNTQMGHLSSDGIRIYLIDSLTHPSAKLGGRGDPFQNRAADGQRPHDSNRLLALQLPDLRGGKNVSSPTLAWSQGRSIRGGGSTPEDRYFLGPPLPVAGRLLSLVEVDRELRLIAFQAETGEMIWEQPLAAVDRSAVNEGERAFLACEPILAGDLVICPTQAGVLTAVDPVTGTLVWSYYDADLPIEPTGRQRNPMIARGRPGFASRTVVHRERVLHLTVNSSQLHCLARTTGELAWTAPRQRACSIAAVTDDLVILLEDQACRALRLTDGAEVWQQALSSGVTGTGITFGAEYLVPLDHGRFALVDLQTGKLRSWQPPRTDVALGNLTVCGDWVYSTGPGGLSAFPQMQLVKRRLSDSSVRLTAAERAEWEVNLKFAEADLNTAEQVLERTLQASVPARQQAEFQGVLRELLYHRLEAEPAHARDLLPRLRKLAATPAEQGRYLARQARMALESRDLIELKGVLRQLGELPMSALFPSATEAEFLQSASACSLQILAEMDHEYPEFAADFRRDLLDDLASRPAAAQNLSAWRYALRVCADDEQVGPFRDQLARRLQKQGQRHAAELLWSANRHHTDSRLAAESLLGLMDLWITAGWSRDAAPLLGELSNLDPALPLPGGQTVATRLGRQSNLSVAKEWQVRLAAPTRRIRSVSVRPQRELELPSVEELQRPLSRSAPPNRPTVRFGESARRLTPGEPLAADVLVRMQGAQSALMLVDKTTSQIVRDWPIPVRHSHPWPGHVAIHGHFLPLGVPGELRGYSLLELAEDGPLWTQFPEDVSRRRAVPSIGPANERFVSFQSQNVLLVCDPWDGSLLWQRRDLEPNSGLYADPGTGIVGDEHCISVFGVDRLSYVTYETMTGRRLHKGRLEIEPRHPRKAFGRKIFSVAQSRGQWQACIWDPLSNAWALQEPLGERNFAKTTIGSPEVGWLTAEGRLRLYDVPTGARTLDLAWEPEELEALNQLQLLTDGPRTYVNMQRNMAVVQTREYNYPAGDTILPCIHLRDDLYAIDRETSRVLWRRSLPSRTLLKLEPAGLPFLVLLSRIRDQHDNNLQSLLVEVLDAQTGELLARQDHLTADRIVNAEYDAVEQTIRLIGQKTAIEIHYSMGGADVLSPREVGLN